MVTPPLAARLPFGFGQVRETPEPFGRETIDNPRSDLDALPQSGMQTLMDLGGMVSPLDPFAVKDLMSGKPEYPKAQGFQCSD